MHPVLPLRAHGKLTFPLCYACSTLQNPVACTHDDADRALHGTWCSPEIHKALDVGYQMVKTEEVWDFGQSEVGLFAEYINKFLKLKTEASGWPADVVTEEQMAAFVTDFKAREDVELEPEKMAVNPGMRALAKLCLNR